jgi:rod shape-determining protein MreC
MKVRNPVPKKNRHRFIVLVSICAALLLAQIFSDGKGPFQLIGNFTIIPMQKGLSYFGSWIWDITENLKTLKEVKAENEELKAEVEKLNADNLKLREEQYELQRLRDLYKLDEYYADYEKIGARVIANSGSNWFSDFTINKGSNDGIKVNMNVMAGTGLVGIVVEVGPDYARVRSIIDDASNVSGLILSTSDTCIVRGDLNLMSDGRIRFEKLANNDNLIVPGDEVVTSHVSSRFLQGLFIGYISEIHVDSNNLTRSGYITPAVDFSKIQEVLVITLTKEASLQERTAEQEAAQSQSTTNNSGSGTTDTGSDNTDSDNTTNANTNSDTASDTNNAEDADTGGADTGGEDDLIGAQTEGEEEVTP